jgi:FtsH-binding integral membrane protein
MKRLSQTLLLIFCSLFFSGCYLIAPNYPTLNMQAVQVIPIIMVLSVIFIVVGVGVTLSTTEKEKRDAALLIAGAATAVFLLLLA